MSINKIQFQKGISILEFMEIHGTEDQCFDALYKLRWPNGFVCPGCASQKFCQLSARKLLQCNQCHKQTSITAGTIFSGTKLLLKTWFMGIYFMTQNKKGISALDLKRKLGISYKASWRMRHKLMQVMMEREENNTLSGRIELDDAYLGGERAGRKRGRGSENKTPFLVAVQTDQAGHPQKIQLQRVDGFKKKSIHKWAKSSIEPDSLVVSDGLACFAEVTKVPCRHEAIVCGGGCASIEKEALYWVNTTLGNLKTALRSTYHWIKPKHAQRYLAEFQYKFNRRYELGSMIDRLLFVSLKTAPMPEWMLRLDSSNWLRFGAN